MDSEWVLVDGSYVRAHQHAGGARRGAERAIGGSRGGPTTKIYMACDAHGNPIDFEITGGEVHDAKAAPEKIQQQETKSRVRQASLQNAAFGGKSICTIKTLPQHCHSF